MATAKIITSKGHDGTYTLCTLKGEPVVAGSKHRDFRGDLHTIVEGTAPHKPGAGGYIYSKAKVRGQQDMRFYASVCDLEWRKDERRVSSAGLFDTHPAPRAK